MGCICFSNSLSIISRRQIDETTIDPLELLKNLKGWTVKKYKCTETNGRYRVDKTYRHPKSKKWLRSLCKVREFILDSSYTGKASDNGEGGTQIEKVNLIIKELVEGKDGEEEKLNRIIAGPSTEKEKDKVDKYTMLNRISQVEAMLTAIVLRYVINTWF
ncbi:uncharacterized protein LOC110895994 isoform X2 [Helianthus annuus]|uniref:uncharacterized protein LOC110895994 isoform X2 n=1 Tax=Helianthus annuus TaxID=4232 RepID=UPI000B8F4CF0|nr:uncharacterized protein LOC110895994 isoform X2 [Helianthus annuus]